MKVLITGGAGFIGSHLVDKLLALGHEVIAFDDFSSGSEINLKNNSNNLEIIHGDILDRKKLAKSLKNVDSCFHFAAAVGVEKILKNPIESIKTNIHGSENVLELCSELGIPVMLASTSEVYGKNSGGKLTEDSDRIIGSPLLFRWSYSDAKALDEALASALAHQNNFQFKAIRFFNTVGPRQSSAYGMVIPKFFKAAIANQPLIIHGDGSQQRIFCHIEDAVRGTIALWENKTGFGEAFNLGGIEETTIIDLAHRIIALTKSKSEIQFVSYAEMRKQGFEDMPRRLPDISKITTLTGWVPKKTLSEILSDYLDSLN